MVKLPVPRSRRGLVLTLVVSACALVACNDPPPPQYSGMDALSGQRVRVRPSGMPEGARWQGCYASPQLGQLVLAEHQGGKISGRYLYTRGACEVLGELRGAREGNLARFQLRESTAGCPGWRPLRGEGYLLYSPSLVPGQPAQLLGERSYLRLRRVTRDLGVRAPYDARRVSALRAKDDHCDLLAAVEEEP